MTVDFQTSPKNDPLADTFLLPRTLGGFTSENSLELEAAHKFLTSKALDDPGKLLKEAAALLDQVPEGSEFHSMQQFPPKTTTSNGSVNDAEHPQRRRPALGRKRAQFSFKPSQSKVASQVDLSVNINNVLDPDEFFAAHERFENAEKELRKSRGDISDDPIQCRTDMAARRRRPGIRGKTASYRHLYPKIDGKENLVPSQGEMSTEKGPRSSLIKIDMLSGNILHPEVMEPSESMERQTTEGEKSTNIQGKGSIAAADDKINGILDELMSNCRDLNEGEVVSVLQERLQVKPIPLGKISLPDLGSVQRADLKSIPEIFFKPRKPLSFLQQVKASNAKTSTKSNKNDGSLEHSSSSPTPPRSPFASISILRKRKSQEDSLKNPLYTSIDLDDSSSKRLHSAQGMVKEALSSDVRANSRDSNNLDAMHNAISPNDDTRSSGVDVMLVDDSTLPSSSCGEETTNRFGNDTNLSSSRDGCVSRSVVNSKEVPIITSTCLDKSLNETIDNINGVSSAMLAKTGFVLSNEMCARRELEENSSVSPLSTDESIRKSNSDRGITSNTLATGSQNKDGNEVPLTPFVQERDNEAEECSEGLMTNITHCTENQLGTAHRCDGQPFENSVIVEGKQTQESGGAHSIRMNEQAKRKSPPQKQCAKAAAPRKQSKRELSLWRKSLAGAGTSMETGVRRSTRIRSRPLEHWRGERFLYGRVHNSLPTVIGLKYSSPGGKESGLKVKSYVSEEFAELVEIASLH